MEDDITKKKAEWIIREKMELKDDDKLRESSMEYFPDRYLVEAVLITNQKKKIVTKDHALALEVFTQLSRRK